MATKTCCTFHFIGGPEDLDCDLIDPSDLPPSYDASTVSGWHAYGHPDAAIAARVFSAADIGPVLELD